MKQSPTHVTRKQSLKDSVDIISKKKLPNGFATFRRTEADSCLLDIAKHKVNSTGHTWAKRSTSSHK